MKIHKEYTPEQLWNGAANMSEAVANVMSFFAANEEFNCIDFVSDTTSSTTLYYVLFAHKERVPRIDENVKYAGQNYAYGLMMFNNANVGVQFSVSALSAAQNGMKIYYKDIKNMYLVFTRNENDECMFTFYNNSSGDATSIIFAKDLSGEMCIVTYQGNAGVTIGHINKFFWNTNLPTYYLGETKKYLLPCIIFYGSNLRAFKRLFWSLNLPQGYRHTFTLSGKQYIESAECNAANKATLTLLYDEG